MRTMASVRQAAKITAPDGTTLNTTRSSRYVLCRTTTDSKCADCGKRAFISERTGDAHHTVDYGITCMGPSAVMDVPTIDIIKGSDSLDVLEAADRARRNKGLLARTFIFDLVEGKLVG